MEKEEEGSVIPIIDLQESPFPYPKLREACENWGCFRVVNHNVPKSTMSEMKTVSRSLLDLPTEVKNRNTYPTGKGYIPLRPLNSIYESLGLVDPSHTGAIDTFCSQLDASSNQREIIEKYVRAVTGLFDDLLDRISKSVGLSSGKDLFKDWLWNLRMNKYNFTSETLGSYGAKPHTDPGFLTLVQDDDVVGGLQVTGRYGGSFVSVESSPGNFFVNLGDLAEVWSNGRFNSSKHCVCCKEESVRVSIGAFMRSPPKDLAVEAPEEFVDGYHPRLYGPVKYGDYMALRIANNMDCGEALSLVRL